MARTNDFKSAIEHPDSPDKVSRGMTAQPAAGSETTPVSDDTLDLEAVFTRLEYVRWRIEELREYAKHCGCDSYDDDNRVQHLQMDCCYLQRKEYVAERKQLISKIHIVQAFGSPTDRMFEDIEHSQSTGTAPKQVGQLP
ncbi:hypothetical protein CVT26_012350 [Gymnopilus dilepis]|uniref:Uncharacterized protein n=1 Tax=Gymnopilus dilepis TaxID=231916 RepID=A0A409YQ29_9AGAR|nr:hypothetical protein CVT26_012350 [Gymnopilus dilepis]